MLGKRGQFYLIAAIIIVLILYSLAVRVNVFQEQPRFTDFNKIAGNYINEVAGVVNNGVYNKLASIDIQNRITEFTQRFLQYARTRDPNIGLVYVYADDSKTVIENHLPGSSVVRYDSSDPSVVSGTIFNSESETVNEIGIDIGGESFVHDVPVKLRSFSSSYFQAALPNSVLKIDLAGVPYTFDTSQGNNPFNVVIKTETESSPGSLTTNTCQYSGSGGWTSCT